MAGEFRKLDEKLVGDGEVSCYNDKTYGAELEVYACENDLPVNEESSFLPSSNEEFVSLKILASCEDQDDLSEENVDSAKENDDSAEEAACYNTDFRFDKKEIEKEDIGKDMDKVKQ